jgi:ubiquitin-like protein Nedd8
MDFGPQLVPLEVKMKDGGVISVDANRFDTVSSLKESLARRTGLYPSQQRLVYAGKILANEMSLDYYRIRPGAQIYFLPVHSPRYVDRLYYLPSKLLNLLNELPTADTHRYIDIVTDIKMLIKDPTLLANARIDPDIRHLLVDAVETVSTAQRPTSARTKLLEARGRDQTLDSSDHSIIGLNALLEDDDSETQAEPEHTNLRYRKRISNKPLPTTWSSPPSKYSIFHTTALSLSHPVSVARPADSTPRHESFTFEPSTSQFAQQLAILNRMGFTDDDLVLEALTETNGNIQLAVQLLRDK